MRVVLMLQGPMGPFFNRLAKDLLQQDCAVYKVNFNGGDDFFYRKNSAGEVYHYRGDVADWSDYLETLVKTLAVTTIYLYGDCRVYHRIAISVAERLAINVVCFEEGYVRPDYITVEQNGVNGYSALCRCNSGTTVPTLSQLPQSVGKNLRQRIHYASLYYISGLIKQWYYSRYQHHRSFSVFYEAFSWVRCAFRVYYYNKRESSKVDNLLRRYRKNYFLVPLQIVQDSQIAFHSQYNSLVEFIEEVISSFAKNADKQQRLVFKHHPMDMGHTCYLKTITRYAEQYGISDRVIYIHSGHQPSLLKGAKGVVTINSTMGLSSIHHGTPVITLGKAIYDKAGLTFQGTLDKFWQKPGSVNRRKAREFILYLTELTQVNGNFYKRVESPTLAHSGLHLLSEQQMQLLLGKRRLQAALEITANQNSLSFAETKQKPL